MNEKAGGVVAILLILFIVFAPLGIIWAINTLFSLSIPYSIKTWAAAAIMSYFFGKSHINIKKS